MVQVYSNTRTRKNIQGTGITITPRGKGFFYYKNGAVFTGSFMNGHSQGPWKYTDAAGNIFIGTKKMD